VSEGGLHLRDLSDRQLQFDGSFLTELKPEGPSFHTACVAEGIVAAAATALEAEDEQRWRRYARSWAEAVGFMRSLAVEEVDTFCMPHPDLALGGVRFSPTSWSLRIDVAAHYLIALVNGARLFSVSETSKLLRY
jgi:hypothetical protein